jgi:hypothetical protein
MILAGAWLALLGALTIAVAVAHRRAVRKRGPHATVLGIDELHERIGR